MDARDRNHDGRIGRGEALYDYVRHPHVHARKAAGPVKTAEQQSSGFNGRVALKICAMVGTMQAAYFFAALALLALPPVLGWNVLPSRTLLIVGWISQTFIQLVMLAVLQLGQNLLSAAADKRAEATYLDAEAVLEDARQIQEHLKAQDAELSRLAAVHSLVADLHGQLSPPAPPSEGTPKP